MRNINFLILITPDELFFYVILKRLKQFNWQRTLISVLFEFDSFGWFMWPYNSIISQITENLYKINVLIPSY